MFNLLFVKEVEKKHVVHCIDCARKISNTLEGFVILEEYSRDDLIETYDSFALFTPTPTPTAPTPSTPITTSSSNLSSSLTSNVATTGSVVSYVNPLANASANVAS